MDDASGPFQLPYEGHSMLTVMGIDLAIGVLAPGRAHNGLCLSNNSLHAQTTKCYPCVHLLYFPHLVAVYEIFVPQCSFVFMRQAFSGRYGLVINGLSYLSRSGSEQ